MEILATRDTWWMAQCEAALLAEGIPGRWVEPWQAAARGVMLLDVPTSEAERVSGLLSEQLGEDLHRRAGARGVERWVPLLLQPAFATALCLSLLLLVFFALTGGADEPSAYFREGAMVTRRFLAGEWWRMVTAATLHADLAHVLGNASFLLVLGWAANERFGAGVALWLWLATAVLGFVASLFFSEATSTVGASGGLFGLLGAAGGHGVRNVQRRGRIDFPWRERLRVGGAAVLLLAFTAFSPEANIAAHVGGFFAGFVLGYLLPRRPLKNHAQLASGLATVVVLVGAWLAV